MAIAVLVGAALVLAALDLIPGKVLALIIAGIVIFVVVVMNIPEKNPTEAAKQAEFERRVRSRLESEHTAFRVTKNRLEAAAARARQRIRHITGR